MMIALRRAFIKEVHIKVLLTDTGALLADTGALLVYTGALLAYTDALLVDTGALSVDTEALTDLDFLGISNCLRGAKNLEHDLQTLNFF